MFGQYKVLFTNSRIKRDTVPKGVYVCDIRRGCAKTNFLTQIRQH